MLVSLCIWMFVKSLCAELDWILRQRWISFCCWPHQRPTSTSDSTDCAEYEFLILLAAELFPLSSDTIMLLNILLALSVNIFQTAIPLRSLKFHAFATDQICHKRMICYFPWLHAIKMFVNRKKKVNGLILHYISFYCQTYCQFLLLIYQVFNFFELKKKQWYKRHLSKILKYCNYSKCLTSSVYKLFVLSC